MTTTQDILARASEVVVGNYSRCNVVMVRGKGSELWDAEGKRYLDLFAGFGGAILGHCNADLISAATKQMETLWHVGNTFHNSRQVDMAEQLNRTAFTGQAFFCHSGLEANEAACKIARLHGQQFNTKRWKIISLNKSFHGRSLAMIAASGNPAIRVGFEPVVPGFVQVDSGSIESLERAIDDETAAIIMEPIQGEGGVNMHTIEFAQQVRQICDRGGGLILIFDEVWTGCGRTGRWFGYQHFIGADSSPIEPDIMTLGKAIGGGLPVGAILAKPAAAKLLVPGKHGCTLGGNFVCMAVANAIFHVIRRDGLLAHASALGEHAMARLTNEPSLKDKIKEVRGGGLMLGIELAQTPNNIVQRGLDNGLVINLTAQNVVRLAPALTITRQQWDHGLDLLIKTILG